MLCVHKYMYYHELRKKKYLLLLLPLVLLEEAEDHADRFSFPEAVREEGGEGGGGDISQH